MAVKDELGKRMKEYYEQVPKTRLMKRTPVAIRIDGKAFHTFTNGFEKPFDHVFMTAMQQTMQYLCEKIQGCVLGYTQSDEITLILIDYQTLTTSAWFDYEVQKICSITASMATMAFNKYFGKLVSSLESDMSHEFYTKGRTDWLNYVEPFYGSYKKAITNGAMFDARCFNIPKEEVANLIYWRQLDATRNSIQMVGQAYFSHSQLHGKSCNDIQDMLVTKKNVNWNDYPTSCKRGTCCIKKETEQGKSNWVIDDGIPIFKGENRSYIETLIYLEK